MLKYEKSKVFSALVTRSHFMFHAVTLSVWRRTSAGPDAVLTSWSNAWSMFFGSPSGMRSNFEEIGAFFDDRESSATGAPEVAGLCAGAFAAQPPFLVATSFFAKAGA